MTDRLLDLLVEQEREIWAHVARDKKLADTDALKEARSHFAGTHENGLAELIAKTRAKAAQIVMKVTE